MLPQLFTDRYRIAVSGSHGKTTTTAWLSYALEALGENPGYAVGGEAWQLDHLASAGSGKFFVSEADESDGTLQSYHVDLGILTNAAFDHMEHFDDENDYLAGVFYFCETGKVFGL